MRNNVIVEKLKKANVQKMDLVVIDNNLMKSDISIKTLRNKWTDEKDKRKRIEREIGREYVSRIAEINTNRAVILSNDFNGREVNDIRIGATTIKNIKDILVEFIISNDEIDKKGAIVSVVEEASSFKSTTLRKFCKEVNHGLIKIGHADSWMKMKSVMECLLVKFIQSKIMANGNTCKRNIKMLRTEKNKRLR